jgi:antitoxin HicB
VVVCSPKKVSERMRYSMSIVWSDEDQAYLVLLPEWADRVLMPATHGSTYSEAAKNGQEVLELLIESCHSGKEPLPLPKMHVG